MYKPISYILHSFLLLVLIGTGSSIAYYLKTMPDDPPAATRIATLAPTVTTTPVARLTSTPVPSLSTTMEPVPDTGWSSLRPGLEQRVIPIYNDQRQPVATVHIWRIDQKRFRLDVAYADRPKSLDAWQKETNADLVMNGGYFSIANDKYFPDGLTIVGGKASGRSFVGYGGMLAINPSGAAELRWLVEKPYNSIERLQAALQAFPILVKPGGQLGFGQEKETNARARRTVIAQDKAGRILFIVIPEAHFTLHGISLYLTESDLNLDVALNLDGGGSTGILVANPREIISPNTLLPFVILVYPR
jgi:phosphodiester glycosidase